MDACFKSSSGKHFQIPPRPLQSAPAPLAHLAGRIDIPRECSLGTLSYLPDGSYHFGFELFTGLSPRLRGCALRGLVSL